MTRYSEELTEAVRIMLTIEESLITGEKVSPNTFKEINLISSTAFMVDYCS